MKRIDMIHELITELQRWNCFPAQENAPGDEGYVANNILAKLEELGMTPPPVPEPVRTEIVDHFGNVLGVADSTCFVHRWESEE